MIVLDASAVLALMRDEPGADVVAESLRGALVSAVNLAEVIGKLLDVGIDVSPIRGLLESALVRIEPFTGEDAELAGLLRRTRGGRSLALGDRCCLALALRVPGTDVLTADRAWARLRLPLTVRLLR